MDEEKKYKQHILINIPLVLITLIVSVTVIAVPWHAGIFHTLVNACSILALCYSHYVIQYHEIRTLIRIVISINVIFLAIATPIAYG